MTGLEKILAEIAADCNRACENIKDKADKKNERTLIAAKLKAAKTVADGKEAGEKNAQNIIERAKSAAELQSRTRMLETKQECIKTALENARQFILSLSDKDYFSLILEMLRKQEVKEGGVIRFSKRDLSRMPEDFEAKLPKELSLSKEPVDIDGGFILVFGMVELNLSFKSIFSEKAEILSDEVSKILFQ